MNPYVKAIYIICLKYTTIKNNIIYDYNFFRFVIASPAQAKKFPFAGEELKEVMVNSKIKIL